MDKKTSVENFFWVALGGVAGAVSRYGTSHLVITLFGEAHLYTATAIENIAGSFLMGFCYVLLSRRFMKNEKLGLFLLVGAIGSYTTYSGYSTQAVMLIQESGVFFLLYVFGQLILGLFALLAGMKIAGKKT